MTEKKVVPLKMGLGLEKQTPDYRERTEKTKAINKAISSGDTSSFKDDPAMMSRYKRESMMDRMGGASDNSGIKSISGQNAPAEDAEEDMSSIYDENRRRYEEFMKNQQPQQPKVTPEMRREALSMFESQQGAGQVPYYMAAARRPQLMPMMPRDNINYRQVGAVQPQFPENRMPGYGGQGVQPNQDQPSAARARELIMAGDVEAGMRMLKASAGMEDTSLKSADALQYMQKTGDQAGTEQILKSSVGLPSMATGLGQRQVGRQINRDQFGMPIVGGPNMPPRFMQQNPNMSPAFQYAAQNYETLGGSQRLGPRPMEMMSVAERGQINDMAQAMADQEAKQRQDETDYQAGMDMVMRGGMGKGGPRTGPQMPRFGGPQMPRFGGKGGGGVSPQIPPMRQLPSRQPVPFASMLASRFGGFGGQ
jgi:hypothetical protein